MIEPETPMLDKMETVHVKSQSIGEFLEWLQSEQHVAFMVWRRVSDPFPCSRCDDGKMGVIYPEGFGIDRPRIPNPDSADCSHCNGKGYIDSTRETWVPDGRSIEQLLADHFGIDLQKAAEEKQAILTAIRRSQETT